MTDAVKNDGSVNKFMTDFMIGGVVGCATITTVTPIMNYTNHGLISRQFYFPMQRWFDGVVAYNTSVVPMIGVSMALNTFFLNKLSQNGSYRPSEMEKLCSITVSGMCAGAVGALPEGIAQAQQLAPETAKLKSSQVIKGILASNGFFALSRGVVPTMCRQGIFTIGYMGLMPMFSAAIRKKVDNPLIADIFSACVSGLMVGVASAPFNRLRFERQLNFHQPDSLKTYASIFERATRQNGDLNLFYGWKPRVLMSACSMFLLYNGKKMLYDRMPVIPEINSSSPTMR